MKRFELILLLLGFVTVAFAYAGFADRFANVFVSMNTLGVIIAITHIAGYIVTRRGKNRRLAMYKRKVFRSAIRIADNKPSIAILPVSSAYVAPKGRLE